MFVNDVSDVSDVNDDCAAVEGEWKADRLGALPLPLQSHKDYLPQSPHM